MSLIEAKVEVPPALADTVNDVLLEESFELWSVVEDILAKRAWLVGIFETEAQAQESWAGLQPLIVGLPATATLELKTLAEAEWRDSYKAHFHAWRFGRLHWVPIWENETFQLPAGDAVLWLDPGLAFGTGNHETTRLCVERLVEIAKRAGTRGRVVDAGCGSGILALSAAKLGFSDVRGFDNDPEVVRVSEENAALNGLEKSVRFSVDDLVSGLASREANVLMANILANVLIEFRRVLVSSVAPQGTLILSGILSAEREQVIAAFREVAPDWAFTSQTLGEWSDVVLTRP